MQMEKHMTQKMVVTHAFVMTVIPFVQKKHVINIYKLNIFLNGRG